MASIKGFKNFTQEYRRIRHNYLQFIRRHSMKGIITPSAIPQEIKPKNVKAIHKEYEKEKEKYKHQQIKRHALPITDTIETEHKPSVHHKHYPKPTEHRTAPSPLLPSSGGNIKIPTLSRSLHSKKDQELIKEYRRIRSNYIQYLNRHGLRDEITPSSIPQKITHEDVVAIQAEYDSVKLNFQSLSKEYRRIRRNYLQFTKRHELQGIISPPDTPSLVKENDIQEISEEYENLKKNFKDSVKRSKDAITVLESEWVDQLQRTFERLEDEIQAQSNQDYEEREIEPDDEQESLWYQEIEQEMEDERKKIYESFPEIDPYEDTSREERRAEEYPWAGQVILDNLREEIESWNADPSWSEFFKISKEIDRNKARNILEGAVSQYGEEVVAMNCEGNATKLHNLLDFILYGSEGRAKASIDSALVEFMLLVTGKTPTAIEAMEISDYEEDEESDE